MRRTFLFVSSALALAATGVSGANAASASSSMPPTPAIVEKTQFYWNGNEYCFYDEGWRGPGCYLCG